MSYEVRFINDGLRKSTDAKRKTYKGPFESLEELVRQAKEDIGDRPIYPHLIQDSNGNHVLYIEPILKRNYPFPRSNVQGGGSEPSFVFNDKVPIVQQGDSLEVWLKAVMSGVYLLPTEY